MRVDVSGLLAFQVQLGKVVQTGNIIAYLLALDGPEAFIKRTPIRAGTDGKVISLRSVKYVWPECSIAKITGDIVLENRKEYLLED